MYIKNNTLTLTDCDVVFDFECDYSEGFYSIEMKSMEVDEENSHQGKTVMKTNKRVSTVLDKDELEVLIESLKDLLPEEER